MSISTTNRMMSPADEAALARTADLMEALAATYALMAHADGEAAGAERRRLFALMREMPAMSVFSQYELAGEVAEHEANYRFDPEVAQYIARERIAKVSSNRRAVRQIVDVARQLIAADGVAHPAEYRTLAEIKSLLAFDDLSPTPKAAASRLAASR